MIEFKGKYTTAKVMINEIDETCASQIVEITNHPAFTNKIVIMPDTHAGKGSVIGFTMPLGAKVVPNTIGVDIGCGMLSTELYGFSFNEEELAQLDIEIRKTVPFGFEVLKKTSYNMKKDFPWNKVSEENRAFCLAFNNTFNASMKPTVYNYEWFENKCRQINMNFERAINSIGTLGGGNHFIEIDKSKETGNFWLTIHTGSRQFGSQICKYWQNAPTENRIKESKLKFKHELLLIKAIFTGKSRKEIPEMIKKLKAELGLDNKVMKGLDYIEGKDVQGYLADMIFAQAYASENRHEILKKIWQIFEMPNTESDVPKFIESVHNYIDFKDFMIRKGAISAHKGEVVIIPFNMEDGILICEGLGNSEWNNSAPHGAGRIKSRSQAKMELSADVAKDRMESKGIFTSVVPVDEVKEAYKDPKVIEEAIKPTVKIIDRLIPIMNLKDGDK